MGSIITAEGLGKRYQIGQSQEAYGTLRDSIASAVRAPLNRLRGARSSESTVWALKDVSFEVQQGEVVGLIGRNGAGKSTLLKLLARITDPSSGRAEIRGRVASLLEVGTGFHPELTGRENIFLNGAILGMKRTEITRKFDEIVAFSEVERYLDTPVKRYSSGMFMRLAFAVAAHLEPEILLVDEVLAVGDLAFQKKCMGKMGEVAQQGRTIFFVSHNMGSIASLCNRAIYLAGGTIKQVGSADEVVRSFMGEMLENRIEDLDLLRTPGKGKQIRFLDIRLAAPDDASASNGLAHGVPEGVPDGVEVEGGEAGGSTNLLFGQPITYALTVHSDIEAQDLSIAVTVFDSASVAVGTLFGRDTFSLRAGETRSLQLTVRNTNLGPGRYFTGISIGVGGADAARSDHDVIIGKPAFEVSGVAVGEGSLSHWQSFLGHIVFHDDSLKMVG